MPIPYKPGQVLRAPANWKNLRFYQKMNALFQLTFIFCERFLPKYGDRTVDQMIQAARSGKQNIVEGSEDGKTSTQMELNLLNVARSSVGELREDYLDHIRNYRLALWEQGHPRFQAMQDYTREHNQPEDYLPFASQWSEEEFCNTCLTLCYQIDAMMNTYLAGLEKTFVTEGGIKERMHKARTGYREEIDSRLQQLEQEAQKWKQEVLQWEARYNDLKQRALDAYNKLKAENDALRAENDSLKAENDAPKANGAEHE